MVDLFQEEKFNVVRRHYLDLSNAIGPFPELLLSVSNRLFQHSFIDLQTKADINRASGLAGASMLLDHIMMRIEQSHHYIPLVMDILREEVALADVVHKMERSIMELTMPVVSRVEPEYVPSVPPITRSNTDPSISVAKIVVHRTASNMNMSVADNQETKSTTKAQDATSQDTIPRASEQSLIASSVTGNRELQVSCSQLKDPDFEGWITKQGGTGLTPRNWRRRWFVLKEEKLYYFKTPDAISALGVIHLPGYTIEKDLRKKNAFKATKNGARTYFFITDRLEEKLCWMDVLRKATNLSTTNQYIKRSASQIDHATVTLSTGLPHDPIPSPDTTVAATILAAERLKSLFDSLCITLMMVVSRVTVNLAQLRLLICLRLQYTRDNTPEVQGHLMELEEFNKAESVITFLVTRNFLGYLNFDILEAFKSAVSSDEFNEKLEEYQLAHRRFIENNFENIIEVFNRNPRLRPASIVGLPEIKVKLATPWKSRSLYYWKELVNDIVDWGPYIVITRVEFNCISITYQVLPFIIPRVVKDLTNETIVKRFTAEGATFTIPDELVQDGIADNQWIMDTIHEHTLLKKTRSSEEGNDPVVNESNETTDQPLEEPVTETGGYEDELFLSPSPGDLQCPVCYLTVREPHQLSCCGATLCQVCSDRTSANVQCPCCRNTNHQMMVDKSARRRVMSLSVTCTVPGCHWSGELLDLEKHRKMKDKCPQRIGNASIIPWWRHQKLLSSQNLPVCRKIEDFNEHMENNAESYTNPFYTSDGGYKATLAVYPNGYGSGKGTHVSVFIHLMRGPNDDNLEFPITGIFTAQVLNWKGNNHSTTRGLSFDDGIPKEYRERVTTGERAGGRGDDRFLPHDDLMKYIYQDMMCIKIDFYPIKQTTGCSPPSWCDKMYSTSATPPCTRTLFSYSVYRKTNSEWYSQPFYSSDKGYKLQLRVDASGFGSGDGTHLSLAVLLMKGEYDDTLSWPFDAAITLQLLNWPSDDHHKKEIIEYHKGLIEYRQRVVEGIRARSGQGIDQFIHHTILNCTSNNDVRFLDNDSVCFRILSVDIIN